MGTRWEPLMEVSALVPLYTTFSPRGLQLASLLGVKLYGTYIRRFKLLYGTPGGFICFSLCMCVLSSMYSWLTVTHTFFFLSIMNCFEFFCWVLKAFWGYLSGFKCRETLTSVFLREVQEKFWSVLKCYESIYCEVYWSTLRCCNDALYSDPQHYKKLSNISRTYFTFPIQFIFTFSITILLWECTILMFISLNLVCISEASRFYPQR